MGELVSYRADGGIATVAMDDGKVNIMSSAMIAELNAAFDRAESEKAAVLLTGRAGSFSSGFDLKVLMAGGAPALDMLMSGFELAARLLAYPHPLVVACTGHAIAMGVFVVLCGDERIGADGAFKIGANEVQNGLTMPYTAVEVCRQRLTRAAFSRALNTATIYDPAAAVTAGFLDRIVPAGDVERASQEAVKRLAALPRPAYTRTKMRLRDESIRATRAGVELDRADFGAMLGMKTAT